MSTGKVLLISLVVSTVVGSTLIVVANKVGPIKRALA